MLNKTPYSQLPTEEKAKGAIEAMLVEYDIDGKKDKPLWTFLVNPSNLKFSDAAEYDKTSPIASAVPHRTYSNSTGRTLTITDMLMDTWYTGKSLQPLVEGVRALLKAKTEQNQFSPPVLAFLMGTKRFAPCVITKLDWIESRFLSGAPGRISMSIVLEEIPTPPTKAELERREKVKREAIADRRQQQGRPRLDLTDRQQKAAIEQAKRYLNSNKSQFSAEVQGYINLGKYQLKVNKESGDVEMMVGEKSYGIVLRSLGEKFLANPKITTVPLKANGKLPELPSSM